MDTTRRGFLGLLGGVTALAVMKPFTGWVPQEVITPVVVEPVVATGNVLLTPQMITKEALKLLHDNLVFVNRANAIADRRFFEGDQWDKGTITTRKSNRHIRRAEGNVTLPMSADSVEERKLLTINLLRKELYNEFV